MIKPTPIVQMANEITLFQRKIYNYLIKNSMGYLQKDILQREFLSSISEIKSLFNNNNYAFIKKDLSVLRKTTVNISLLNRDRKKVIYDFNLINEMKFTGENKIEFSLPSLVIEEIVGNFNNEKKKNLYFTNLNLSSISNLKSKYSLSLYENLKAYTNGFNMPKVDIDTFRTLVGVEDGKFPLMGNLKKKVIDSSVQEINEKTELNVEYEMFKTGRKITHIKFYSDENKKISDLTNEYIDISQEYITFWDTYIPKHCKDKESYYVDVLSSMSGNCKEHRVYNTRCLRKKRGGRKPTGFIYMDS